MDTPLSTSLSTDPSPISSQRGGCSMSCCGFSFSPEKERAARSHLCAETPRACRTVAQGSLRFEGAEVGPFLPPLKKTSERLTLSALYSHSRSARHFRSWKQDASSHGRLLFTHRLVSDSLPSLVCSARSSSSRISRFTQPGAILPLDRSLCHCSSTDVRHSSSPSSSSGHDGYAHSACRGI
jgi:hypothetical protein